jgi:hypothetical protein
MHVRVVAAGRQGIAEMHFGRGMVALREGGASTVHDGFDTDVHERGLTSGVLEGSTGWY